VNPVLTEWHHACNLARPLVDAHGHAELVESGHHSGIKIRDGPWPQFNLSLRASADANDELLNNEVEKYFERLCGVRNR